MRALQAVLIGYMTSRLAGPYVDRFVAWALHRNER